MASGGILYALQTARQAFSLGSTGLRGRGASLRLLVRVIGVSVFSQVIEIKQLKALCASVANTRWHVALTVGQVCQLQPCASRARIFDGPGGAGRNLGAVERRQSPQPLGAGALHDDLAAGRLVEVPPDWASSDIWLTLYYPPYAKLPLRVATFSDFFELYVNQTRPL